MLAEWRGFAMATTELKKWEKEEIMAQRFAEVIRYAQRVGKSGTEIRSSQKNLADKIEVAGTMITRYLSGKVQFGNIKSETARLIAEAAGLHVGSLYAWIVDGKDAAMVLEEKLRGEPVAFKPLEMAEKLVVALRKEEGQEAPASQERYKQEREYLAKMEVESPLLFGRFIASMNAEKVLAKLEFGEELEKEDRELLMKLIA